MWTETGGITLPDGRELNVGDIIAFKWWYGAGHPSVSVAHDILWKISSFAGQPERGAPFGILGEPWRHETGEFAPPSISRPPILLPNGYSHHGIHPTMESIAKVSVDDFPARSAAAYKDNLEANAAAMEKAAQKAGAEAEELDEKARMAVADERAFKAAATGTQAFEAVEFEVDALQSSFKGEALATAAQKAAQKAETLRELHQAALRKVTAHAAAGIQMSSDAVDVHTPPPAETNSHKRARLTDLAAELD